MKNKIIISAYNIHQGGGAVLLQTLLASLDHHTSALILLDTRYSMDISLNSPSSTIQRVKPSLVHRFLAELTIKKVSHQYHCLICFGNLPPLFYSKIPTIIYLQSLYLIKKNFICWHSIRSILRTIYEWLWFHLRKSKNYIYIVQTPSVKKIFTQSMGKKYKCIICGFSKYGTIQPETHQARSSITNKKFIYIASGEPHKNHKQLIKAWIELKKHNIAPQLVLVLNTSKFQYTCQWINNQIQINQLNIKIINHVRHNEIDFFYKQFDAMIFPSLFESLGLPLIEAQHNGLPIIASETDFVRDIVTPEETFDPKSHTSIARAVRRFLFPSHHLQTPSSSLKIIDIILEKINYLRSSR